MDEKTSTPPAAPPPSADAPEYAVDLHDVRKSYRGRIHDLRGIEMQARR